MSELRPGDQVERYVVERLLGRGGAAEVYAVEHRMLGTRHALKVLHRTDARHREQLLEEGRAQALLDPTFVLPVTDVVPLDDGIALLMPYVAGCSLEVLLQRRRLTEAEVARIVRPVVLGVASAHARGLVHRDLKPANILVDQQRQRILRDASPVDSLRVRVADFGIVRRSGRAWVPGERVQGSPAYMSPEVLRGAPADERADLWSLGVLLFEMLVGRRPFRGLGLDAVLDAVRHAPIALDAVPGRWQPVVDGLLTRDVAARMGSIQELLDRLPSPVGAEAAGQAEQELLGELTQILAGAQTEQVASSFVGREAELDALAKLVDHGERVVTVLGPGGVGKSALMERYAVQTARRWPGGTVSCALEEADGVEAICRTMLDVLGAPLVGDEVRQVADVLAGRPRTLVLLDGVEQRAEDVANLVQEWCGACPDVVFLVGSRVRLRVDVGRVLKIGPLSRTDARTLLEARVVQARGGGSLDVTERAELDRVVGLLENMPLALELAAARATQTLGDLASELESSLVLGDAGGTTDTARHATLLACLEWSVDLLRPIETTTLLQLSIFVGGCTRAAAAAVVDGEPEAVGNALAALVDQSLVTRDGGRLSLLESTRQLVQAKLDAVDRAAVAERHARWFSRFGTWEWLVEPDAWDDGLDPRADRENIRAALRFALDAGAPVEGPVLAGLARAYARIALRHGPMGDAARVCALAFDRLDPEVDALERATLGLYLSDLRRLMGVPEDAEPVRRRVDGIRASSDAPPALLAFALVQLARLLRAPDPEGAVAACEESLAVWRQVARPGGQAEAHLTLGVHLATHGDVDGGLAHMKQAEQLARTHRCGTILARALYLRSYQELRLGNAAAVPALAFEGLAVARATGSVYREAAMLILLGDVSLQDDVETAAAWLRKALDLILKLESMQFTSIAYESLAVLEAGRGNDAAASVLFDAAVDAVDERAALSLARANRARHHLRCGRFDQAIADLEALQVAGRGQLGWNDQATLARALARIGALDRAESVARTVLPKLGRDESPMWFVEVQLALGRVALARGDVDALARAVTAADGVALHPIQHVEWVILNGEWAVRSGDAALVVQARTQVDAALEASVISADERSELEGLRTRLAGLSG